MFQNGEITKGPNFFLRGRIFLPNWPEKSAKSWQHWLCTVCTVGGGEGTLTKPVLSVNSIHFTPKKCNQVCCSFQGHYGIKPLPVHCTVLSPDVVVSCLSMLLWPQAFFSVVPSKEFSLRYVLFNLYMYVCTFFCAVAHLTYRRFCYDKTRGLKFVELSVYVYTKTR